MGNWKLSSWIFEGYLFHFFHFISSLFISVCFHILNDRFLPIPCRGLFWFQNQNKSLHMPKKRMAYFASKKLLWLNSLTCFEANWTKIEVLSEFRRIESWKSVNENIYFWAHTLIDWKTNLWIGKSMVQTTFKMIFTNLNWFFDKKLYVFTYGLSLISFFLDPKHSKSRFEELLHCRIRWHLVNIQK